MIDSELVVIIFKSGLSVGIFSVVFIFLIVSHIFVSVERNKMVRFITKIKKQQEYEEYQEQLRFNMRYK
jgi:hypothetical protein